MRARASSVARPEAEATLAATSAAFGRLRDALSRLRALLGGQDLADLLLHRDVPR